MEIPGTYTQGEKTMAILCHVSLFLGVGFLLPLIVFLVKKDESPWLGAQAREVLNFHISLVIYGIVCFILFLFLIGVPLLFALGLLATICSIIGAIRASEGVLYHYPLTIRLV
jgi:uncharacterized Tic20 family protein